MKIPVILVTGFLGSGKTTFLHRLAERHPEWRIVFLINEFADVSLDDDKLAETGQPTHSVVGGSLFCECNASEFILVMREQVLAFHAEKPVDAVIIETSGMADPEAIGTLMGEHGLTDSFMVKRIVSIVAPGKFQKLFRNLPVIQAQIKTSDLVVINKTDLANTETIESTVADIRTVNPDTEIVKAEYCDIAFELNGNRSMLPTGELSTCDANPFHTQILETATEVDFDSVVIWLAGLSNDVLRVKGKVLTTEGWMQVDKTVDGWDLAPGTKADHSRLVVIVHDDYAHLLPRLTTQFEHLQSV